MNAEASSQINDDRTLHLATCGSVDDGKSTLIGRLLVDAGAVLADQLDQVAVASKRRGLADLDLSLLTDGLRAEREQGITIDVAWRTFRTSERRFSLADSPGHVQYTCNMAVAASGADVAVVLLDAKKGTIAQTRRHVFLSRLVGVGTFVVCVNKMDAVGYSAARFAEVRNEVTETIASLSSLLPGPPPRVSVVPLSALTGENVVFPSTRMPWYDGLPLLRVLERVPTTVAPPDEPGRLAVQWVARPADATLRTYAGRVARGSLGVGDPVVVLPSGYTSTIASLATLRPVRGDGRARAGESVTLTLTDAIDVSRGDVIAHASEQPRVAREIRASLVVLSRRPFGEGAHVLVKQGTRTTRARITKVNTIYDLDRAMAEAPKEGPLAQNEVVEVTIALANPLVFDPFETSRGFGSVLVSCPQSGDTLAAGALR
jgi:sulfate adenylyltransferase subunit 1